MVALAATLSLSLVLSACGHAQSAAPPATRAQSTTTTTNIPSITTTTLDANAVAVLSAYRAGWTAFEHAAATSNAFDPALPATMVDPLLQQVRQNLVGDKASGVVTRGTIELHPKLESITGTSAVVLDCSFSSSELVYAASGKPVPPVTPPESDGDRANLVLSGVTWKVSRQSITEGKCPSGY